MRLFSWIIIFGEDQLYHLVYSEPLALAYCSMILLGEGETDTDSLTYYIVCYITASVFVMPKAVRLQIALEGRTENEGLGVNIC